MRSVVSVAGQRAIVLEDGLLEPYRERLARLPPTEPVRLCFAAARIVMQDGYCAVAHTAARPGSPAEIARWIDWDATAALRRRLDAQGFGVAEAMDTAQRFSIGWEVARELIERCGGLRLARGFVAGAGVDHLGAVRGPADLVEGVLAQVEEIQRAGGIPMILPLLWLARERANEATYVDVYTSILRQARGPLLLHWLGPAFHPQLVDYFPGQSLERVLASDPGKVRGVKLSLLDPDRERSIRRSILPRSQIVLTGDDLHFGALLRGEEPTITGWTELAGRRVALGDFSHGLLGVLEAVAPAAALALAFLAHGDLAAYDALMAPCEALGRHVFAPPTSAYKAGLALVAWLRGEQTNAMLVHHEERARDRAHAWRLAELLSRARLLDDAGLARARLEGLMAGDSSA